MCPRLSANYVSCCPPNMAQVSVWAGNLQFRAMHGLNVDGSSNIEFGTTPDVIFKGVSRKNVSYLGVCMDYIESLEE